MHQHYDRYLSAAFRQYRRPTNFTPLLSKIVSRTSKAMRLPDSFPKVISPLSQSENETVLPSGRSVHP